VVKKQAQKKMDVRVPTQYFHKAFFIVANLREKLKPLAIKKKSKIGFYA